jgi:hypothetical protein
MAYEPNLCQWNGSKKVATGCRQGSFVSLLHDDIPLASCSSNHLDLGYWHDELAPQSPELLLLRQDFGGEVPG